MSAIWKRREERRVFRIEMITKALELEFANDLRLKQTAQVRERRDFVTRPDLLGHRCAADHGATLDHHDFQPSASEIRGGHEPVMPGSNHNGIEFVGHHLPLRARIQSSSTEPSFSIFVT